MIFLYKNKVKYKINNIIINTKIALVYSNSALLMARSASKTGISDRVSGLSNCSRSCVNV